MNLQNIPSDTLTRSCFVPESGNVLVDADYSSKKNKYHILNKYKIVH